MECFPKMTFHTTHISFADVDISSQTLEQQAILPNIPTDISFKRKEKIILHAVDHSVPRT